MLEACRPCRRLGSRVGCALFEGVVPGAQVANKEQAQIKKRATENKNHLLAI